MLLTSGGDHNLDEVPYVLATRCLALETAGVARPELRGPPPGKLVRHDGAALEQHLPNQTKAQWKWKYNQTK